MNYTERWCDDTWPVVTQFDHVTNRTTYTMPSRTIYFTFISAVLYLFPMIVMTIAYSVIIIKLRASTIPGERVDAGYTAQQKTKRKLGEWYFTMEFLAGCFAYSHSALNPLIYAGFNKNFKQGLRGVWQTVSCNRGQANMENKPFGNYHSSTYATAV